MNHLFDPKEKERVMGAREGFSGRLLTNNQFDEVLAITGILKTEIQTSGKFKEKLGDFAYAFARTQKMDVLKAETTIRDVFRASNDMSMNEMRKSLMAKEVQLFGDKDNNAQITEQQKDRALTAANEAGQMIETGNKISFFRASSHKAEDLALELGITTARAKSFMADEFKQAQGQEFHAWGKEQETKFYRPQIEAEQQNRSAERSQRQSLAPART